MNEKREQLVSLLKIAEQCQRYDDMVRHIKSLIDLTTDLTFQQLSLLTIAYKNVTSSRRTAWRAITNFEMKEQSKNSHYLETVQYYKTKIERELLEICDEVVKIIEQRLLPKMHNVENMLTLMKAKGDYYRYICEFSKGEKLGKATAGALDSYNKALELANEKGVVKTNPIKLGVVLNLSVMYYEIVNDTKKAIQVCEKGFNEASNLLNDINTEEYKDTTTILQLMYDNLTSWRSEEEK